MSTRVALFCAGVLALAGPYSAPAVSAAGASEPSTADSALAVSPSRVTIRVAAASTGAAHRAGPAERWQAVAVTKGGRSPLDVDVRATDGPAVTPGSAVVTGFHAPGIVMGGPVTFTATVRGAPGARRDVPGAQALHVRVDGADVAFPGFRVFSDSAREVVVRWAHPPLVCLCRATVTVSGEERGPRREATVLVLPGRMPLLAALLAVLAGLGELLIRRRRRLLS